MPPLVHKLLIIAAVEGLLLTPLPANGSRNASRKATPANSRATSPAPAAAASTVQIDYKTAGVRRLLNTGTYEPLRWKKEREEGLEVHGIAGLLSVSPTTNYLIAITSRKQVAWINRIPVYVITDVALIPLSSQSSAQQALAKAREHRARHSTEAKRDAEATDDEDEGFEEEEEADVPAIAAGGVGAPKQDAPAGGTVGTKGLYGLFAQKWFSRAGWTAGKKQSNTADSGTATSKPLTDLADADDEPGNQDITLTPPSRDKVNSDRNSNLNIGTELENKLAPELESFPALPLTEEERAEQAAAAENVKNEAVHSLIPKLLHTTKLLLASSRSFYFSYDMDITRPLSKRPEMKSVDKDPDAALWTKVDTLYFWNRNLQRPFINSNSHHFILPLMQGFVGQRVFDAGINVPQPPNDPDTSTPADTAPEVRKPFILTLISRRSTKRAGLRYLRRGVDSEGNTANYVETEQLLSIPAIPPKSISQSSEIPIDQLPWAKTYSFLQVRGSIPLYFQQSPYTLRPRPVLLHSDASNKAALEKHFNNLERRYHGDVFCVSLVERGGAENIVGGKYEQLVHDLDAKREATGKDRLVGFNWFDFHKVCRGMKFERVSLLLDEIEDTLARHRWTEVGLVMRENSEEAVIRSKQKGIVRTNCMDCLDRTNVVQSACGRRVLEKQLLEEGVDLSKDPTNWFNLVWADNGDAISKQYASTAALKGDFTRTRKRNYRGALTDFGLTMSRYFNNIISDFFTQVVIDFLLGKVSSRVFDEFEVEMMSKDPAAELGAGYPYGSVGGVRQNAIDISSKIVISDDTIPPEQLIRGWTFLTPYTEGTLRTFPFRETVVLLTNQALYVCKFDFAMEKVESFERIDLRRVREVQVGTYITSTLAQASVEEETNVGFVVRFTEDGSGVKRVNTRTVKSKVEEGEGEEAQEQQKRDEEEIEFEAAKGKNAGLKFFAFKALPGSSAIVESVVSPTKEVDPVRIGTTPTSISSTDSSAVSFDKGEHVDPNASPREHIRSVAYCIEKAALAALPDAGKYLLEYRAKQRKEAEGHSDAADEAEGEGVRTKEEESGKGSMRGILVKEEDIISLEQAKKKTGLLETLGYQFRRLVWA